MTDEQINAAIAEACGWTDFVVHPEFGLMGMPSDTHGLRTAVDWYTVDLNAMHEAEKVLTIRQEKDYFANLEEIVGDLIFYRTVGKTYRATARQRAEAFLRALGKWKEATDKDSLTVGGATTEQSSVDHLRDATKMMEVLE